MHDTSAVNHTTYAAPHAQPASPAAHLCVGSVVHERLRPAHHKLSYHVFSLLVDVDRIDEAATTCRWFSRNRANLMSFYDRDFGARDGVLVGDSARTSFAAAGFSPDDFSTIKLLAYPRILGYVFNPLSVFYGLDRGATLKAVIYEVSNTFGERIRYVVAAGDALNATYAHRCAKHLFVSPFASATGRYDFRITEPADTVRVGVAFRDGSGPLIRTHFTGAAQPLTNAAVVSAFARHPAMTLKVMAAIHVEAFKLWRKGVPLQNHQMSPRYSERFENRNVQA